MRRSRFGASRRVSKTISNDAYATSCCWAIDKHSRGSMNGSICPWTMSESTRNVYKRKPMRNWPSNAADRRQGFRRLHQRQPHHPSLHPINLHHLKNNRFVIVQSLNPNSASSPAAFEQNMRQTKVASNAQIAVLNLRTFASFTR